MNAEDYKEALNAGSEHLSDELISTYLDDESAEAERLVVGSHLSDCAECTARLEKQR